MNGKSLFFGDVFSWMPRPKQWYFQRIMNNRRCSVDTEATQLDNISTKINKFKLNEVGPKKINDSIVLSACE